MIENKKNFEVVSNKNPRIILPNTLTIIGVCIGLSSIKFAMDQNYGLSIIALLIAGILDTLDGRIARLIKGTSKVGKELDSLTDVVSFGVAPAVIMYFWSLNELGKLGWLIVLVYVVCTVLRLARFNIMTHDGNSAVWKENFFEGVPSPAAAGILARAWHRPGRTRPVLRQRRTPRMLLCDHDLHRSQTTGRDQPGDSPRMPNLPKPPKSPNCIETLLPPPFV